MIDPSPGRLGSLGEDRDHGDAELIVRIVQWSRETIELGRRGSAARLLREAMWFAWEEPRLPPPLVSRKYPRSYPWSPLARLAHTSVDGRRPQGGA
jgi:hypothetical protein